MIVSVNNTSFKSRNAEIKFADDLARRVNKVYPRISSTLVKDMNNIRRFPEFYKKLCYRINTIRNLTPSCSSGTIGNISYLKSMSDIIKQYKIGNCSESACLSSITLEANGIKEHYPAVLQSERGDDFDHAVVLVPNGGKPYIVDSWLGFADYVPKVLERYKKEFSNHFDLFPAQSCKMIFKRAVFPELYNLKNINQNVLKEAFPELVITNCKKHS